MDQPLVRMVAIVLCTSTAAGCSTAGRLGPPVAGQFARASARPANEILLTVRGEAPILGKLLGIDGDDVSFLPSPYFNLPTRRVKLGEITTIEVTDVDAVMGPAAGWSFVHAFTLVGARCAADAHRASEYMLCAFVAGLVGGVASLIGLLVGGVVDAFRPVTYRFDEMSVEKRRQTIQTLVAR